MNERKTALECLLDITGKKLFASFVLESKFESMPVYDKRSRAFITRLVEGTLERMIFIDYCINGVSKTATVDMDSKVLAILRLGTYQIYFMDKVPDHSAVNESVKLAKDIKKRGVSSFVNGVLREICRKKGREKLPNEKKNPAGYISVKYSFPKWMVKSLIRYLGRENTEKMLEAQLAEKPVSLRVNTLKISADELTKRLDIPLKSSTIAPDVLICDNAGGLIDTTEFKEGLFYIQDVSSAASSMYYDIKNEKSILDVCASPGGKSICAYLIAEGRAKITARDVSGEKTARIDENIKRLSLTGIQTQVWDARVYNPKDEEKYDLVIADLPCSGLGVMGRKTDIKYHITKDGIDELCKLQREILGTVYRYVKPGGTLVYSTCTVTKEENTDNARWIEENLPLKKEAEKQFVPGESEEYCDGFYVARFRKIYG